MSSAVAVVVMSNRCDSTIWNASPARMCSLATSTISRYSAEVVRRTTSAGGVSKIETAGGARVCSAEVIRSSRATASS